MWQANILKASFKFHFSYRSVHRNSANIRNLPKLKTHRKVERRLQTPSHVLASGKKTTGTENADRQVVIKIINTLGIITELPKHPTINSKQPERNPLWAAFIVLQLVD